LFRDTLFGKKIVIVVIATMVVAMVAVMRELISKSRSFGLNKLKRTSELLTG